VFVSYNGTNIHHSFAMPQKNEQNTSETLKLKSLETNYIHLQAKVDRNGKQQVGDICS
jgi:hypothetical protein